MITPNDFTQINNDTNGNPRYVCHYVHFLTEKDNDQMSLSVTPIYKVIDNLSRRYNVAISRANKIGGRKFHNKQYGGGIVFQSYNLRNTCNKINELIKSL